MALTRKYLRALDIPDDKIDEIIGEHTAALENIKTERDTLKAASDELQKAQAEVERLTGELEKAQKNTGDAAKVQADFDAYKQQVQTEKDNAGKAAALRKALKGAGVARDEFAELLLGRIDLEKVEMDGDSVKDVDKLIAPLKEGYAGCFATTEKQGVPPADPPMGGKLSSHAALAAEIAKKHHESHYGVSTNGKE